MGKKKVKVEEVILDNTVKSQVDIWEFEGKKHSKHRIRAKEIDFRESKSKEELKAQERAENQQALNEAPMSESIDSNFTIINI